MSRPSTVTVRAAAKINLELVVGPPGSDGYHPVATVFQGVSLYDDVTASWAPPGEISVSVTGAGIDTTGVPRDGRNLAARAAALLLDMVDPDDAADLGVALHIDKRIPVGGGMAGGSADAAAALLACDALWQLRLSRGELQAAAARLGADVPFALLGGTAVGLGRGDRLTPALAGGPWHWVLLVADGELSTPEVYEELDRLRSGRGTAAPAVSQSLMVALRSGDPVALGAMLRNDLQPAACSLRPSLKHVIQMARDLGVPGVMVSGSGPTVAVLAEDGDHAEELMIALYGLPGIKRLLRAEGPTPGCRVTDMVA